MGSLRKGSETFGKTTHRFFIEPLTGTTHIVFNLYKRFVTFTQKLATSEKAPLRNLFNRVKRDCRSTSGSNLRNLMLRYRVKRDCRSTTGSNLRNLMLRYNANSQEEINSDVLNKSLYKVIPTDNEWKITMAKELIDVTRGNAIIPDFQFNEIMSLLEHITT